MERRSETASLELLDAIEAGASMFDVDADALMGATDCPHGCEVEPDGVCLHGWLSAGRTARLV